MDNSLNMSVNILELNWPIILFMPHNLLNGYNESDIVFLYGDFEFFNESINIFVTRTDREKAGNCIGAYYRKSNEWKDGMNVQKWIELEEWNDYLNFKKLWFNGFCKDDFMCTVIYYDHAHFIDSGSFEFDDTCNEHIQDHFSILVEKLQSLKGDAKESNASFVQDRIANVLLHIVKICMILLNFSKSALNVINFKSNILIHLMNCLNQMSMLSESEVNNKRAKIRYLNFLCCIAIDLSISSIFLNWFTSNVSPSHFSEFFKLFGKTIVQTLRELIHWLTGNPAGFKLNFIFSNLLATFFLFNIDIWFVFIALLEPVFLMSFPVFHFFGKLGITFLISITADVINVLTIHVSCICIYAARLYNIQITALIALWRLFLGRKKNPLRNRVDSFQYTPEQLFIGTLGFTILLFLLPTTLIYHIVFSTLKLMLLMCQWFLMEVVHLVCSVPVFPTILWVCNHPNIVARIQLQKIGSWKHTNCLTFHAHRVPISWWETVKYYLPEFSKSHVTLYFSDIFELIVFGQIK